MNKLLILIVILLSSIQATFVFCLGMTKRTVVFKVTFHKEINHLVKVWQCGWKLMLVEKVIWNQRMTFFCSLRTIHTRMEDTKRSGFSVVIWLHSSYQISVFIYNHMAVHNSNVIFFFTWAFVLPLYANCKFIISSCSIALRQHQHCQQVHLPSEVYLGKVAVAQTHQN